MSPKTDSLRRALSRIFVSVRHETRLSARLSEACIEALWVGLSLWVGTSDLPRNLELILGANQQLQEEFSSTGTSLKTQRRETCVNENVRLSVISNTKRGGSTQMNHTSNPTHQAPSHTNNHATTQVSTPRADSEEQEAAPCEPDPAPSRSQSASPRLLKSGRRNQGARC